MSSCWYVGTDEGSLKKWGSLWLNHFAKEMFVYETHLNINSLLGFVKKVTFSLFTMANHH